MAELNIEIIANDFFDRVRELEFDIPDSEWEDFYSAFLDAVLEVFEDTSDLRQRLWKLLPFARNALTKYVRGDDGSRDAVAFFKGNMALDVGMLTLWNEPEDDDLSYSYRSAIYMVLKEMQEIDDWVAKSAVSFLRDGLEYWTKVMKNAENDAAAIDKMMDVTHRFSEAANSLFLDVQENVLENDGFRIYMVDLAQAVEGRRGYKVDIEPAITPEFMATVTRLVNAGGMCKETLDFILMQMYKIMPRIVDEEDDGENEDEDGNKEEEAVRTEHLEQESKSEDGNEEEKADNSNSSE